MKLLTLNCHSWMEENQLEKIRVVAKNIASMRYDVIALQEVSHLSDGTAVGERKKGNYVDVLLRALRQWGINDYTVVWTFAHYGDYGRLEEGTALLTRHPIIKQSSVRVSETDDVHFYKRRTVPSITISYREKVYTFYSCHLGWWHDSDELFVYQVQSLLHDAAQHETFFLLGDFNNAAHLRNEGYDYLCQQGVFDMYERAKQRDEGITMIGSIDGWDGNEDGQRIDYIFCNKPLFVQQSCTCFNGQRERVVSDHYGVWIELTL